MTREAFSNSVIILYRDTMDQSEAVKLEFAPWKGTRTLNHVFVDTAMVDEKVLHDIISI